MNKLIVKTEEIGMKVNSGKTQLLCVLPNNGCDTISSLDANGHQINWVKSMKLLGFMLGEKLGADQHFEHLKKKFRGSFWSLVRWRKAGLVG